MRQVKFRYWNGSKVLNQEAIINHLNKYIARNDKHLMQFTGLFDKQGVEIYEGDICRCYGGIQAFGQYEYSGIYEVKYTGNGFDMIKDNCGYGWGLSETIDEIEVIGNIYENPELLNDELKAE